jgi:hypothetical protein
VKRLAFPNCHILISCPSTPLPPFVFSLFSTAPEWRLPVVAFVPVH